MTERMIQKLNHHLGQVLKRTCPVGGDSNPFEVAKRLSEMKLEIERAQHVLNNVLTADCHYESDDEINVHLSPTVSN